MKKRCKYCTGIIKVKEEEIKNVKDNGRGIICDLCGAFIEIPKKITRNPNLDYGSSSRSFRRKYYKNRKRRIRKQIIVGTLLITCMTLPLIYFIWYTPFLITPFVFEEKENSTFTFKDEKTRFDISDELNISILASKEEAEFNNNTDLYNLNNFKEIIFNRSSLIILDIRTIPYLWILSDPTNTSIYKSDFHLVVGGRNYDFRFFIEIEPIYDNTTIDVSGKKN